jgi:hypothetical protein
MRFLICYTVTIIICEDLILPRPKHDILKQSKLWNSLPEGAEINALRLCPYLINNNVTNIFIANNYNN